MLGTQAVANPGLVREINAAGHELAIHGWTHRCVLAIPPTRRTGCSAPRPSSHAGPSP